MEIGFELPEDFMKPFQKSIDLLQRGNLRLLGNKQSTFKKFWRFVYIIPGCLGLFLSMVFFVINMVRKGDNFFGMATSIPFIFIIVQGTIKGAVVLLNDNKINDIIIQLAAMWPKDEELTENQLATKLDLLGRITKSINLYYWVNVLGAGLFLSSPMADMVFRKYILGQETPYILPFGYSYPFEATETLPVYLATCAFELLSIIKIVEYQVGVELLIITLTAHISTIFTLLQDDVLNMKPMLNQKRPSDLNNDFSLVTVVIERTLQDIVRKHQKLITLTKKFDNIFNVIVFVNLLFASILICFFGFVSKEARGPRDTARNIIGAFATMLAVFNLCYYGQLINEASEGLAHSAYVSLWYDGSTQYQKMLCFFILSSQHPCSITNLKVAPVTLRTFTAVLSSTYSYFNLVNKQYED